MSNRNERSVKENLAQRGLWPLTLGKWYEIDKSYIKYIKYRGYDANNSFDYPFLTIKENISSINLQFSMYLPSPLKIPMDSIVREVNIGEIQHYIPNNEIQFIDGEWYQFEWNPKPGINYNKAAGKCDFKGCISNRFAFTEVKKEGKDIEKRSGIWIIDNALKITNVKVLNVEDIKTMPCIDSYVNINLINEEKRKQEIRNYLIESSYNLQYNAFVNKSPIIGSLSSSFVEEVESDIKLITKKKSKLFEASNMINVNEKLITKK